MKNDNTFENQIVVGKVMPLQKAVDVLVMHHKQNGSTEENVLDAFSNLNKHLKTEGATVVFVLHPDQVCFTMRISDGSGKQVDTEIVGRYDGQPINHVH